MVALPDMTLPTIDAIYGTYNSGDWRRDHLGASLIGSSCERSLWYTFRWATNPKFSQRMLRLFETGIREEYRILDNLRKSGITVYSEDPDTKQQIHYDMFGGHYAGSLDGIGAGFKESKAYHVIECKTSNTKTFKSLQKNGVEKTKFEHYCQMQQYMKWSGLDRAFYFCVAKETDEIYGERIKIDKEFVKTLELKAERIIFSDYPPDKTGLSTDFKCRYCTHSNICHYKHLPEISCRVCSFVTPSREGGWICGRDGTKINRMKQREGCEHHIFNPACVPLTQVDASEKDETITYDGGVVNGASAIPSPELGGVIDKLISGEIEI